jgi:poly(A) polymerase
MFPATARELEIDEDFRRFVRAALRNTDLRVADGKSVTPMFLLGVLLWAPVCRVAAMHRNEEQLSDAQSLNIAAFEVVGEQQRRISVPKRFTVPMREMMALQPRFYAMRGRRAMNLLEHRRFRAAYDFMMLLADIGRVDPEIAAFWSEVQSLPSDQRMERVQVPAKARNRRRRRQRKSARDGA